MPDTVVAFPGRKPTPPPKPSAKESLHALAALLQRAAGAGAASVDRTHAELVAILTGHGHHSIEEHLALAHTAISLLLPSLQTRPALSPDARTPDAAVAELAGVFRTTFTPDDGVAYATLLSELAVVTDAAHAESLVGQALALMDRLAAGDAVLTVALYRTLLESVVQVSVTTRRLSIPHAPATARDTRNDRA